MTDPTPPTTAAGRRFSVVLCGHPVAGNTQYPCTEPPGHGPLGYGVDHRHDGAYLAEARGQDGSALRTALDPALLRSLRRIAREARRTYVGSHWPSMREMRIDGVGFGLVDNVKDEAKIRRFLDAFSPEMMVDVLAALPPSAPPALSPADRTELIELAAAMVRGELTCEKGHRAGKSEHVHFDDVHRWGQRLARVASTRLEQDR